MERNDRGVLYREVPSEQMDNVGRYNNSGRHCDARRVEETELGELSGVPAGTAAVTIASPTNQPGVSCYDGACKSQAGPRGQPVHRLESPWHHLKTVFLVSIIISFIVWLIAYVLLAQYGLV